MAYYLRAYGYLKLGQHQKSVNDFSQSIHINPKYADAYNDRGITYLLMKQNQLGCTDLQKACDYGVCIGLDTAKKMGECELK